jgi:Rieske Fe-S protein
VAAIAGGAVLRVPWARREGDWIDAGDAAAVSSRPLEVPFTVEREDGYRRTLDRGVVYLVRNGGEVRALSATCTHLGCRVAWHDAENAFRCPCHGGRFTREGTVAGGPPPRRLDGLETRVENGRVLVRVV